MHVSSMDIFAARSQFSGKVEVVDTGADSLATVPVEVSTSRV